MRRFSNLLKAIALFPVILVLRILQKLLFWFAFRVVDVMLRLSPRDVEWMPRERLEKKQKQVDESYQQMMARIAASIKD